MLEKCIKYVFRELPAGQGHAVADAKATSEEEAG